MHIFHLRQIISYHFLYFCGLLQNAHFLYSNLYVFTVVNFIDMSVSMEIYLDFCEY